MPVQSVNMPLEDSWLNSDELYVLRTFVEAGVRFLIIGGRAVQFHGHIRPVNDLDLLVERSKENWERLRTALRSLGTNLEAFEDRPAESKAKGRVLWYSVEYLTAIDGVSFADAWNQAFFTESHGLTLGVLSKPHLIMSKQNTGRSIDQDDVKALQGDNRRSCQNSTPSASSD